MSPDLRKTTFAALAGIAIVLAWVAPAAGQDRFVKLLAGWDQEIKFFNPGEVVTTGRIAFAGKIHGYDRILAADLANKELSILVDGPGNNFSPVLSPDGQRLAFTSDRDGNREIYVSDFDGRNQFRVTQSPGVDDFASWSPDGRKLVFSSDRQQRSTGKTGSNLYAVVIIGRRISDPVHISIQKGKNSMPAWSPDGRYVAYTTDRFWPGYDVCVLDLETKNEVCPLQGKKSYYKPSWSQNSRSIHYFSGEIGANELGIFNLKERTYNTLLESVVRPESAVFLRDDKQFLFISKMESKTTGTIYYKDIRSEKFSPMIKLPFPVASLTWADGNVEKLKATRSEGEIP